MDGLIESGSELIWEKYKEAEKRIQELENSIEWFKVCFDTAYEGITIVDEHGYIRMMNDAYCRFISVRKEDVIGRYVEEVIENTRLPVVLQTGIPERNQAHRLLGQDMVVHRIPIWKENRVIGAVGMLIFEGVSELYQIFDRMQVLHEKIGDSRIVIEAPRPKNNKVTFDQIIGESEAIAEAKKVARRAAQTSATILLTGESGVGKELFAKAIHSLSPFQNGPLVIVNCASIPENLLESELFGYEEGAFTARKKTESRASSSWQTKERFFWTRLATCRCTCKRKFCGSCRSARWNASGESRAFPSTFGWLRLHTIHWKTGCGRGLFAKICITA